MTVIVDYGVGNLFSLQSSFKAIGEEAFVSDDAAELMKADRLVLPGVGAFEDAANKLRASVLDSFVRQQAAAGKPLMGICLGMQLLFDRSFEYGEHEGLGLVPGQVVDLHDELEDKTLKVPHMGWNQITDLRTPLFRDIAEGAYIYYVHSYYPELCADTIATSHYINPFSGALGRDNFFGTQFHPEKSGAVGAQILKNFLEL